ncbi:hypothetical protein RhiirB3_420832 [Rhizophagus irregularis]|nr:hypothetical protein RhiirB3_420832 [Rhizophagus irregularis]
MKFIKFITPTLEALVFILGDLLPRFLSTIDNGLSLLGDKFLMSSSPEDDGF